jgi:hypothetical protein
LFAISAIAVVNVNFNLQNRELSALSIANVEALADESDGPTPCGGEKVNGECESKNTINCKDLSGCQ